MLLFWSFVAQLLCFAVITSMLQVSCFLHCPASCNHKFCPILILVLFSVNVDLYKVLVKELAQVLERQFAGNVESRTAGMVINTMGWIEGVGYEVSKFDTIFITELVLL